MHRFPSIFAFGLIAGSILQKCISLSLSKRGCGKSKWLFFIPLANGILYLWTLAAIGWQAEMLLCCLCASALLAVGITDGKTLEIPWGYNLFIGGLGVLNVLLHLSRWYEYVAGFFAVSGLLLLFFFITEGKGIGGGDVKLMAAVGLFLGWERALKAFFVGGLLGVVIHVLFKKKEKGEKVFALGPYLTVGILAVML